MKTTRTSYDIDPKRCARCNNTISFEKRSNKYCSHSCAAAITNTIRCVVHNPEWHRERRRCIACGETHSKRLYCSMDCRNRHTIQRFAAGEISDRGTLSKILKQQQGNHCQSCKNTEWLGQPLPLEIDHIDGNASNNLPGNLRLICPNCHSITPSWKGRNKGNGRKSRGLPTH